MFDWSGHTTRSVRNRAEFLYSQYSKILPNLIGFWEWITQSRSYCHKAQSGMQGSEIELAFRVLVYLNVGQK